MADYIHSFALFFTLLNPFMMSIYMLGLIKNLSAPVFNKALIQGSLVSFVVFVLFAWGGEAIFSEYLQVRFEAFQIFGGIIFLVIGYRFVFEGADTIGDIRGGNAAGMIAMPFMIGPGTVSASVITGSKISVLGSAGVIGLTLVVSCSLLILMKFAHDNLKVKHADYVDRYVDIVGRIAALLVGTIAIDMIINGVVGLIIDF
ncbi:MarC family protein [Acinetobacter portensis]|uniref:MarC family protein n=1 Tax=Acinetobacter portensis TaxID=1839785 RepID=UPI0013D63A7A|nr:MarC family protein [Acinetobacter portensis]